jgi:hypothetical protein
MKENLLIGEIENIIYKHTLVADLKIFDFLESVNKWPSKCIIQKGEILYSVSKWVSPKRTRSYPYSRVYDTFGKKFEKRITIIPIVKDEGINGDRDFLQWSTIALMSLLNVYTIIAYYEDGDKNGKKITNQRFSDNFIKKQFNELDNYHSSALHWNLEQLNSNNLKSLLDIVIDNYERIGKEKDIKFHSSDGILSFKKKIGITIDDFKLFSSLKSEKGQLREIKTTHLLESLGTGEKMRIIIKNYLGGLYYFTIDDVEVIHNTYLLMECKHSNTTAIPSTDDIKDGLLKLMVLSNIKTLKNNDDVISHKSGLRLTSKIMKGSLNEMSNTNDIKEFCIQNNLPSSKHLFLTSLIRELKENNIKLIIEKA